MEEVYWGFSLSNWEWDKCHLFELSVSLSSWVMFSWMLQKRKFENSIVFYLTDERFSGSPQFSDCFVPVLLQQVLKFDKINMSKAHWLNKDAYVLFWWNYANCRLSFLFLDKKRRTRCGLLLLCIERCSSKQQVVIWITFAFLSAQILLWALVTIGRLCQDNCLSQDIFFIRPVCVNPTDNCAGNFQ